MSAHISGNRLPSLRSKSDTCAGCAPTSPPSLPLNVDIEDIINQGTVKLCTCEQSSTFPKCDGTHEVFNRETNSNMAPIVVKIKSRSSTKIESDAKTTTNEMSTQTEEEIVSQQPSETIKPKPKIVAIPNIKDITAEWTLEEIAQHNTEDDCWVIVNNKVYDITSYFDHHPGGKNALRKFAGRDATENVQFHSSKMLFLLNKYFYVGRVKGAKQEGCEHEGTWYMNWVVATDIVLGFTIRCLLNDDEMALYNAAVTSSLALLAMTLRKTIHEHSWTIYVLLTPPGVVV
ncbi:hypothetical protein PROFUN_01261 [Planoprotostelium fungivorum]|uniref:Cytochrome b5 heme-binding domain-containing protein n=1 Tax=Planoprotostelium fungivorum TaxID=1890364 RepID=A0A2P6NZQ1_9EUKA|nr:hypothetical protein PROFUN_01261 [Planoprotostelium fungivorum]